MIQQQSAIEYWEAKFKAQEKRIAELEKVCKMKDETLHDFLEKNNLMLAKKTNSEHKG